MKLATKKLVEGWLFDIERRAAIRNGDLVPCFHTGCCYMDVKAVDRIQQRRALKRATS